MMTKQNFETAARIVRDIVDGPFYPKAPKSAKETRTSKLEAKAVCTAFVLLFRDDNPRFDQERFIKACGVEL